MENLTQPQGTAYPQTENAPPVTLGDWIITFIISAIPVVNIIMFFIWAFGDSTNPSKANWAKASLIMMLIGIVLYIFIFMIIGVAFLGSGGFQNL